jgi:hypothetical protein
MRHPFSCIASEDLQVEEVIKPLFVESVSDRVEWLSELFIMTVVNSFAVQERVSACSQQALISTTSVF